MKVSRKHVTLIGLATIVALGTVAAPAQGGPARTGLTSSDAVTVSDVAASDVDAGTWVVAHGSDVVERTAAENLAEVLEAGSERDATTLAVPDGSQVEAMRWFTGQRNADVVVVIGTPDTNRVIAAEEPFTFEGGYGEAFHIKGRRLGRTTVVFVAGETPKGAMTGTVRLKQALAAGDQPVDLDIVGAPAFKNRVGGHVQTQGPAPGWDADDQAQYYIDHNINVVWGEKYGPPLSEDVLQRYGLGLALEVTLPPVDADWWNNPANASAAYYRDTWSGQRRVVNPFDPVGRQAYYHAFRRALDEHPSTAILYTLFGDYSFTTDESSTRISDGRPCGCTAESSALEVMTIMKQAIDDAGADVTPAAWLWHLGGEIDYDSFMRRLRDLGIGAIYNEAGDSDDWITARTNFDATALKQDTPGTSAYGPNYAVLVSAGGSCESIDPVIGLATPHASASKVRALADAGVENFFLWWGSGEGWSYSANMAVVRDMVLDPTQFDPTDTTPFDPASPEPFLAGLAEREFPGASEEMLALWGAIDAALVEPAPDGSPGGLPVHSWYQRIGVYTLPAVFGGGFTVPITPSGFARRSRFSIYEGWRDPGQVIPNFQRVSDDLAAAIDQGRAIPQAATDARIDQTLDQLELYTHLFDSQLHMLQAKAVAEDYWVGGTLPDLEDPGLRAALEPIAQAEIAELRELAALFATFPPNASLLGSSRTAFENRGDRDKDLAALNGTIVSMELWLENLDNIAVGADVTASPNPQPNRAPENAVDGNLSTLWHSAVADNQWIQADLGAVEEAKAIIVRWNGNAPADTYRLEYATEPGGPWTVVGTDPIRSSRGTDAFSLPAGTSFRYVRVTGLTRASVYGFAINELEVYGTSTDPGPDPDPDPDPVEDDALFGTCPGAGSDTFDGAGLDASVWSSSVRLGPTSPRLEGSRVVMPTSNSGVAGAPLVLQPVPDGPWEATTQLRLRPSAIYHQAGILLRASDTAYLKVDLFWSNGVHVELGGAGFPGVPSVQIPAGSAVVDDTVWLRLRSDGTNVTAHRSYDGETFTQIGTAAVPLAGLQPTTIGLYAMQGATGSTPTEAAFSWFRFTPTPAELAACEQAEPPVEG